ncbi:hypothetical protein F3Y22_tig00117034pilonHSYRG00532 [Hibiscus syriacus]|uniref:Uncharacterized protein n=1 Tax=Hibiscus syriacus TaxID=106335 RepID=A0A6A2WAT6_HIBSY|nr:hypothetical protein F3Y22_tig00117034pilonHSYRG00532 [Hibiscus syriacus]
MSIATNNNSAACTIYCQFSVGMGLLAGSTIMLLTVIWGSCVVVGSLSDFAETGVSTDIWTCYAASIMAISVIPFLIVQLPQVLNSTSLSRFDCNYYFDIDVGIILRLSGVSALDPEKTTCFREAQACHIGNFKALEDAYSGKASY